MLSGKITTDAWFAVRFMAYLTEGNLLLPPKQMEQVGFEEANASLVLSISLTILYWTVLHHCAGGAHSLQVSRKILDYFDRRLEGAGISERERPDYRKWVRFYLDFCDKYGHAPRSRASLGPFLAKLASKNQSAAQQQQASQAVKLLTAADSVAPESPRAPLVPQASRVRKAQVEHAIRSSQRVKPATLKLADGQMQTSPLVGPWPEKQSGARSGVPPILSLRNGFTVATGNPSYRPPHHRRDPSRPNAAHQNLR
jgi:hypothetical protein